MIIDSHAHAWQRWPYDASVPDPATRGSAASLRYEMDRVGVDHALLVAAGIGAGDPRTDNSGNNEYALAAARSHPGRFSVLLDVDSRWSVHHHQPGAADRLRQLLDDADRACALAAVAGITHYLEDQDDGWLDSEEAVALVSLVATDGGRLVSLHARPAWFAGLGRLADRCPHAQFLLHHQGHVDADDPDQIKALVALADHSNVVVKVSGFYYLTQPAWDFPYPDRRVFELLLREFGPARLVWGSDFPVSRSHLTYRQSLEVVRSRSGLDGLAVDAICGDTLAGLLGR